MNLIPPTDSIYKFFGIGGLMLLIFCITFMTYGIHKDDHAVMQASGELRQANYKINNYLDHIKHQPGFEQFSEVEFMRIDMIAKENYFVGFKKDSLYYEVYSTLPDSVITTLKALGEVHAQKQIKFNSISNSAENLKSNFGFVAFLFFVGYFVAILGFSFWYFLVQYPIDQDNKQRINQKLLKGEEYFNECQSCKMSFLFPSERGLDSKDEPSAYFCNQCYKKGVYIEPNLTYSEALGRAVSKAQLLKIKPKQLRKLERDFPKLLRWRREKIF